MLAKVKKNFQIYSKKGVFTFFEGEILKVKEYDKYYELQDWNDTMVKKELLNKDIPQNVDDYIWLFGVLKEI
jgi:hypothetical protein